MKIKIVLSVFILLESIDAILASIGISIYGLQFEKNLFIRTAIQNYGFFVVATLKIFLAAAVSLAIYCLYNRFEKFRKFLLYFAILLCAVAAYGVFSSLYALYP